MSIDAILADIAEHSKYFGASEEYISKYFHEIPKTVSIDRVEFILNICKDKKVLHLGCAGHLHKLLIKVASEAHGVDIDPVDVPNFTRLDLETESLDIFQNERFDLVLCTEILEHLSNPGIALSKIKKLDCNTIITVPNAFSIIGTSWVLKGIENVHKQHICYFSYTTMKELLSRYGFEIVKWFWYNGQPIQAEGLIFVVR